MSDLTLTDLHALALLANGPGLDRCADRSPVGIVQGYGLRTVFFQGGGTGAVEVLFDGRARALMNYHPAWTAPLDLTDAGTALAVRILLALALGLDPGPRGEWVTWIRGRGGWWLHAGMTGLGTHWGRNIAPWPDWSDMEHHYAPTVAALPDPREALAAAVRHVLE